MRRRDLIMGASGALAFAARKPAKAAQERWKVPYGACIRQEPFLTEADYREALARYCGIMMSEGAQFWDQLQPEQGKFTFAKSDTHVAFAAANGAEFIGHTLVWHGAMPAWVAAAAGNEAQATAILEAHTQAVMGHYAGRFAYWNVVNEAVAERPTNARDLRETLWLQRLGPGYVAKALRMARDSDPTARLVLSDYDLESNHGSQAMKRTAFLDLVRRVMDAGAPLDAIGFQAHIRGEFPIAKDEVSRLVEEIKSMGLSVLVTELDVIDHLLPQDVRARDLAVADRVRDFLGAVFAAATPKCVVTWGITDRHTWVPMWFKRSDGQRNRPLPLDVNLREKPMMQVIREFCR